MLAQCVQQSRARLDCDRARLPVDDGGYRHSRGRLLGGISRNRLQRTGYGESAGDEPAPSMNSRLLMVIRSVLVGLEAVGGEVYQFLYRSCRHLTLAMSAGYASLLEGMSMNSLVEEPG